MPINQQEGRLWTSVHEASLTASKDVFRSFDVFTKIESGCGRVG